jgi:hypothetical protein
MYSEENFKQLSRAEQLELANIHWMDSKGYDDSHMFQFSYTHFSNLCKKLGFEKGVIDTIKPSVEFEKKKNHHPLFILNMGIDLIRK